MQPLRFPVSVTMQRIALASRWVDERWEAFAVELDDRERAAPTESAAAELAPVETVAAEVAAPSGSAAPVETLHDERVQRWRCPGFEIELHPVGADGYYLNLSAGEPKVFVLWRMAEPDDEGEPRARPFIVTVSYNEAARFLDVGEQVDAVPMPAELRVEMERFVATHYRPEPRKKAKRNEFYEGEERREGRRR